MTVMEVAQFCSSSRVMIVAGKGGVGTSTVTAALAIVAARAGSRVLIVEVEGKSSIPGMFGAEELGYESRPLREGISARTLTPDAALVDYLETHGMKRVSKRLARSGALEVVATAVPGMKDILVLGKVRSLVESDAADLILVDAPAAGHAISFLTSASGLADSVRMGPVRQQAANVRALLSDPALCQAILVTLPEETPVNELVATAFSIEDRVGVALGPVVVNGCIGSLPEGCPLDTASIRQLAELCDQYLNPSEARELASAAIFRTERHELQKGQIERLTRHLPLPQLRLPYVFSSFLGSSELAILADALVHSLHCLPHEVAPGQDP